MEKERCPIRGDREHFVAKETPISLFAPCSRAVRLLFSILGSIVVSIPACHAGDQGSIPCRGGSFNGHAIERNSFLKITSVPRAVIDSSLRTILTRVTSFSYEALS